MKFLTILVLSLSLLTSSSLAVSLNPPMVYALKEDRSMAATEEVMDNDFNPLIYIARFYSVLFLLGGISFMGVGISSQEDSGIINPKAALWSGAGMTILGGLGLYWSF